MSLSDELRNLPNDLSARRSRCVSCAWYFALGEKERAGFDEYLGLIRAKQGRYSELLRVCRRYGLDVSPRAFRDHCHNHVGQEAHE